MLPFQDPFFRRGCVQVGQGDPKTLDKWPNWAVVSGEATEAPLGRTGLPRKKAWPSS